MPTVKIEGVVRHMTPLGPPCQNAQVKIHDLDQGGGGNDLIFNKKTNTQGKFKGTSKNWKDRNTVRVSTPLGTITQDVPDALILQITVKQGGKTLGPIPYVQTPPGVPNMPVVVPWQPSSAYVAKVNGQKCKDGFQLQKKARAAIEAGTTPVRIEIFGPTAQVFIPLAVSPAALKNLVNARLPGAKQMLYTNPLGAEEILAIAVVILAIGAAFAVGVLATAVAIALVMAISQGYTDIDLSVQPGSGNNPLPSIEFQLSK